MRIFSWGASMLSKRQRSTEVAISEKIAKLTPLPSQVAPSGYGYPSQIFTGVMKMSVSYPLRVWAWQRIKNFRFLQRGRMVDRVPRLRDRAMLNNGGAAALN